MACAVGVAAALVLVVALVVGLPVVAGVPAGGVPRATGVLMGKVVFGDPSNATAELAPGPGVVRLLQRNDVVETVDLGRRNTYSFQLWPGLYELRAGTELPAANDDFCTLRVRIKERQTRRVIFHCTPSETA